MNIYISHSREFDFQKELYLPLKQSQIFKDNNIILPHDGSEKPFLTKEDLRGGKIDLVIAEVSFPSTGQGIELAWANQFNVPIDCIYRRGSKYSNSLTTLTNHFNDYDNNLITVITTLISDYGI